MGARIAVSEDSNKPFFLATTINPIMGHFSALFHTRIYDSWRFASRFDFNLYSFESDYSLGLEYRSHDHASINLRMGWLQGLGIQYQLPMKSCQIQIGLSTELGEIPKQAFNFQIIV